MTMTDHVEYNILEYYNLTEPYPTHWPKEDVDEASRPGDKSVEVQQHHPVSRFSVLQPSASHERDGSAKTVKLWNSDKVLVLNDEPDPLGSSESIFCALKRQGIEASEDAISKNKFLLASITFSPSLLLSQVHAHTSTKDLQQGLQNLARSIDSKSASLKLLVETNFERFVRAKTTIDNVYAEMRGHAHYGTDGTLKGHSRLGSKDGRLNSHVNGSIIKSHRFSVNNLHAEKQRKNTLDKDCEYGVLGVRTPLTDALIKADEIWGPALEEQQKEEMLKILRESIKHSENIFRVAKEIDDCIRRRDYAGLVEEYNRAKLFSEEARQVADTATRSGQSLTDSEIYQIVIAGKMWSEVHQRVESFKRETWRRLTSHPVLNCSGTSLQTPDGHLPLINVLLELGVEDDPAWLWLLSLYDHLKQKINATFERCRVEIEVLRRRLASKQPPTPTEFSSYIKTAMTSHECFSDSPGILEFWVLVMESLTHLLSGKDGILKDILDFWEKIRSFIEEKSQDLLHPKNKRTKFRHQQTLIDARRDLYNGVVELVNMLQEHISSFFVDPPVEDVSLLLSPGPNSPMPSTSGPFISPYARQDPRFIFDDQHPPPLSPKTGQPCDEYAFWPPQANCLSGIYFLEKLTSLVGYAASEMASLVPVSADQTCVEKLKNMVGSARERSIRAVCAAWIKSSESCKYLEDWSREAERKDITKMPSYFDTFEMTLLTGCQKLLYIPEATNLKSGSSTIVAPPPAKLVQLVRGQFISSLYVILAGMVENAEKHKILSVIESDGNAQQLDDRNIHRLLTLSNLRLLQAEVIPNLNNQFEVNFSITLTNESKQVRDALTQISERLFVSYSRSTAMAINRIVVDGINSPQWVPDSSRPDEVRPYVHEALLKLVDTHAEVSTTTPGLLVGQVLSYLLESMSEAFLDAFGRKKQYYLPTLMQATLDMEFVAQTMSQYTTKRASELQGKIYVELDAKTTQEASKQLQTELPEMRSVLKRLREGSKNEFLCFRRERGRAISR